jgi:hypothetical protein
MKKKLRAGALWGGRGGGRAGARQTPAEVLILDTMGAAYVCIEIATGRPETRNEPKKIREHREEELHYYLPVTITAHQMPEPSMSPFCTLPVGPISICDCDSH